MNVQGMRRYYGLLLCRDRKARLVRELDGRTILAETEYPWKPEDTYHLQAWIDSNLVFDMNVQDQFLDNGALALVCEEGCLSCDEVKLTPLR